MHIFIRWAVLVHIGGTVADDGESEKEREKVDGTHIEQILIFAWAGVSARAAQKSPRDITRIRVIRDAGCYQIAYLVVTAIASILNSLPSFFSLLVLSAREGPAQCESDSPAPTHFLPRDAGATSLPKTVDRLCHLCHPSRL